MLYDLQNDLSRAMFQKRVQALMEKGRLVDLTDHTTRTKRQNNYLHLLLGAVAIETGNTIEYVKKYYYKRAANADLYLISTTDPLCGQVTQERSSKDLTVEEMNLSLDRFVQWASDNGMYLPSRDDEAILQAIEVEMSRCRRWL